MRRRAKHKSERIKVVYVLQGSFVIPGLKTGWFETSESNNLAELLELKTWAESRHGNDNLYRIVQRKTIVQERVIERKYYPDNNFYRRNV